LNDAVRSLVAEEVESALEPYRSTLQALATLTGGGAVRRGPGRPPWSRNRGAGRPAKARRGRPAKRATRSATGGGDASKFSNGQAVRYKQGRGEFAAKVVKIDSDHNRVTIERDHDGKKVVRPADKVYAA
jgi:sRNA-binding protein